MPFRWNVNWFSGEWFITVLSEKFIVWSMFDRNLIIDCYSRIYEHTHTHTHTGSIDVFNKARPKFECHCYEENWCHFHVKLISKLLLTYGHIEGIHLLRLLSVPDAYQQNVSICNSNFAPTLFNFEENDVYTCDNIQIFDWMYRMNQLKCFPIV